VEMLRKLNVGTDPLNATAAAMEADKLSPEDAALWFFANYPERWRSWVPSDVATRLETALKAAGVNL